MKLFNLLSHALLVSGAVIQKRGGTLPVSVSYEEFLGNVTDVEGRDIRRDLGWVSRLGNSVYITYGDTLWYDSAGNFRGIVSDSIARWTDDPTKVDFLHRNLEGFPQQFCPLVVDDPTNYAMSITQIIEPVDGSGEGVLYYVQNHRPGGANNMLSGGVATVFIGPNGQPSATVVANSPGVPDANVVIGTWWNSSINPNYGDFAAIKGHNDGFIYSFGHFSSWIYVARVPADQATQYTAYTYWDGETWASEPLANPGNDQSVFWELNSGQIIWSEYYQAYLAVFADQFVDNKIQVSTASQPQGPWSEALTLFTSTPFYTPPEFNFMYAPAINQFYDPSGQSIVITYTNAPNVVQAIRVHFA